MYSKNYTNTSDLITHCNYMLFNKDKVVNRVDCARNVSNYIALDDKVGTMQNSGIVNQKQKTL